LGSKLKRYVGEMQPLHPAVVDADPRKAPVLGLLPAYKEIV
jgi:hypothetical protein